MRKIYILIIVLLTSSLSFSQSASRINGSPYPVSTQPDTLYVVDMEFYNMDERLTTISLQGMLAKTKPMIYCWNLAGYSTWINDLHDNYNVYMDSTYWHDFEGLITHFKDRIDKYYLCNLDDASANVAISACAINNDKIVATSNISTFLESIGITEESDVTSLDEQWLLTNFDTLFSTKVISYQNHSKSTFLGDYSIFAGAFQFYANIDDQLTNDAFARMTTNSVVFGWGDDEKLTVEKTSENNINLHPADWSRNLSVMSNFDVVTEQHTHPTSIIDQDNVHTVCFLMSDGDNINWMLHEFAKPDDDRWYGSTERGQVDIGWTITPALSELAPTIMKYVYDNASNTTTAQDNFVASSSGVGYMYPNLYTDLDSTTNLLNKYMQKADLNIVNIIGTEYNNDYMLPYLQQPNIDAIFYYGYDSYADNGDIFWVNNKPVIEGRYNFWESFNTVQELADKLNNESTNAYSQDGYSLIPVHVWSRTVADVNAVAELLDSNVIVVTPEEFVQRIQNKMGPTSALNSVKKSMSINIYPNPAKDNVQITFNEEKLLENTIQIFNIKGKLLKQIIENKSQITIDVSDLEEGIYFIKIFNNKKTYKIKKIVIIK